MRQDMRLGKGSSILSDRTFYLPTYLHEKDNPEGESTLFLRRCVEWVTKSGAKHRRTLLDVRTYPDGQAMVNDIESHPDWSEAPPEADGNPKWFPEVSL